MDISPGQKLPAEHLAQVAVCVCANVRTVARVITQVYDHILQPSGLTAAQFWMLAVIASNEATTLKPLAERLMMDRTTLSRNLRPLERMGLVEIAPGEDDGRTKLVRLTETGVQAVAQTFPLWQQAQASILAQFGGERWGNLLGELGDLAEITQGR
jgi:DNA-binding MarR family transcriptional regulator